MNELNDFNKMISDKATYIADLSRQYEKAGTGERRMWLVAQMENQSNALRVITERLGTNTKDVYGGSHCESRKN